MAQTPINEIIIPRPPELPRLAYDRRLLPAQALPTITPVTSAESASTQPPQPVEPKAPDFRISGGGIAAR